MSSFRYKLFYFFVFYINIKKTFDKNFYIFLLFVVCFNIFFRRASVLSYLLVTFFFGTRKKNFVFHKVIFKIFMSQSHVRLWIFDVCCMLVCELFFRFFTYGFFFQVTHHRLHASVVVYIGFWVCWYFVFDTMLFVMCEKISIETWKKEREKYAQ